MISSKILAEEIRHRARTNPLLLHKLLPQQKKFFLDKSKTKIIFGGNRSGKTECVARYVNEKAIETENLRIWCSALTFSDSVNIQQKKVDMLMPKHEISYGDYDQINGYTNRKLVTQSNSLYIFKSNDQTSDAFQGDDIDMIWLDEEHSVSVLKECRMRLMDRDGELLLSMTSLKGVTEVIEEIYEDADIVETRYAPLVDQYLPVKAMKGNIAIYFLWTEDNPYIDQDRMREEAKLMTNQEIMSRFYGIPVNLTGRIYVKFNKNVHVLNREEFSLDDCIIYNVLDPHDRKPWAIGWFAVHKTGSCCMFDEYPERNFNEMLFDDKTYDEYAALIKAKEKVILANVSSKHRQIKRIIDPNFGNKTMQLAERQGGQSKTTPREELRKRGLVYNDGIDALEAGHLKVREYLHWEEKNGEIIVQPKLFFTDNCQNAIRHHGRYSRKDINTTDGDVKDKVKVMDKYKDFCDLSRYFVMSNPRYIIPQKHEVEKGKKY